MTNIIITHYNNTTIQRNEKKKSMDRFGKDIGQSNRKKNQDATRRVKRGECASCGNKTHKIHPITRKKTPLTIEGLVIYGQCLRCNPIEGYTRRPTQPSIPETVEASRNAGVIPEDDNNTVVSGLTLDHSILVGAREGGGEEEEVVVEEEDDGMMMGGGGDGYGDGRMLNDMPLYGLAEETEEKGVRSTNSSVASGMRGAPRRNMHPPQPPPPPHEEDMDGYGSRGGRGGGGGAVRHPNDRMMDAGGYGRSSPSMDGGGGGAGGQQSYGRSGNDMGGYGHGNYRENRRRSLDSHESPSQPYGGGGGGSGGGGGPGTGHGRWGHPNDGGPPNDGYYEPNNNNNNHRPSGPYSERSLHEDSRKPSAYPGDEIDPNSYHSSDNPRMRLPPDADRPNDAGSYHYDPSDPPPTRNGITRGDSDISDSMDSSRYGRHRPRNMNDSNHSHNSRGSLRYGGSAGSHYTNEHPGEMDMSESRSINSRTSNHRGGPPPPPSPHSLPQQQQQQQQLPYRSDHGPPTMDDMSLSRISERDHHSQYDQSQSQYDQPRDQYDQSQNQYDQSQNQYDQPQNQYDQPQNQYDQPQNTNNNNNAPYYMDHGGGSISGNRSVSSRNNNNNDVNAGPSRFVRQPLRQDQRFDAPSPSVSSQGRDNTNSNNEEKCEIAVDEPHGHGHGHGHGRGDAFASNNQHDAPVEDEGQEVLYDEEENIMDNGNQWGSDGQPDMELVLNEEEQYDPQDEAERMEHLFKEFSTADLSTEPPTDETTNTTTPSPSESTPPTPTTTTTPNDSLKINDIPLILKCLKLNQSHPTMHEKVFDALFDLSTRPDPRNKISIVMNKGIQCIVEGMWTHMDLPNVQAAALRTIWALAASDDGRKASDTMSRANASGVVDAMLISMRTHLDCAKVQLAGCGALSCLASASADNNHVDDGTSSGAILTVVNAMEVHSGSVDVQEWGLRALYSQCVNSDDNKVQLAEAGAYGGDGINVIHKAMSFKPDQLGIQEWACRLYYCLSSHEKAAKAMSTSLAAIDAMVASMNNFKDDTNAVAMNEAACGALGNLAVLVEQNHSVMKTAGVIEAVFQVMNLHQHSETLQVEACFVLANLSVSRDCGSVIESEGGVTALLSAMKYYPNNPYLQEEGCRAIYCLCNDSDQAQKALSLEGVSAITKGLRLHETSAIFQEVGCGLLATMALDANKQKCIYPAGGIDSITSAMKLHGRERSLQEVCCSALRNLSFHPNNVDALLASDAVNATIRAMNTHEDSEIVQENACCLFWNLSIDPKQGAVSVLNAGEIKYIVNAMQNLPGSVSVQKKACGALWSLIVSSTSEEIKEHVVLSDGVDAIVCAIIMHPYELGLLETACGALASLSVHQQNATCIANAGGISSIIEVMRSNPSSVILLEYGSLLLRNLAAFSADYAEEASSGVSTIIKSIRDHLDAVGLQKEACGALWSLAAYSETCKERILFQDGVDAIQKTMGHNSCVSDIQQEARGAYSQLVGN